MNRRTFIAVLLLFSGAFAIGLPDLALQPARILTEFGSDHVKSGRGSQGLCAIQAHGERTRVR